MVTANEPPSLADTVEDDGSAFLVYSEETPRRIVMRRMTPDLLGVEDEVTELLRPDVDWERGVTEAPTVVKRNGVYHLFYSGGPFQGTKQKRGYAVGHASAQTTERYLGTKQDLVHAPNDGIKLRVAV